MLKLSHHKIMQKGYVTHQSKRHYVPGKWPREMKKAPAEVQAAYRLLVRRLLGDKSVEAQAEEPVLSGELTILELCGRYLKSCKEEEGPKTFPVMRSVVQGLVKFCPYLPAKDFGPLKLKQYRDHLIQIGYYRVKRSTGESTHHQYTRSGINYTTKRIRKIFRWAVGQEIVSAERHQSLLSVLPLRTGRTKAPEAKKIVQVSDEIVSRTLPHLSAPIAAMVRLQHLTGMRPGEVCRLSTPEIDRSDPECWIYTPAEHKTAHLDKHRVVAFAATAQAVLEPWLRDDDKPLFSPAERMAARKLVLRENRKTKVQPSQEDRSKPDPKKAPGEAYTTLSYGRAIAKACADKGIPSWSPNQLRKRAAQRVLETQGLDAKDVSALLGNDPEVAKRFYLEAAKTKAKSVALAVEEVGKVSQEKSSPPVK